MSNPTESPSAGSAPLATDEDAARPSPYAPPYGSAPAYGDGSYGASYGAGAPSNGAPAGATTRDTWVLDPTDRPTTEGIERAVGDDWPYGDTSPAGGGASSAGGSSSGGGASTAVLDAPPAQPRRRRTLVAALVACCLASGVTGAAVTRALDDNGGTTTTVAAPSTITRGTTVPTPTTSGTPVAAAATISPSVVTIAVTGTQTATGGFGQTRSQPVSDTGSGIVLRSDGYIVTNNHVVAAAVDGGTVSVTFSDGTTSPAKIVGTDATSDLAVVKVDGQKALTAAVFADSNKLVVGQTVLAIGAPLGLSNTVTEGIVSTLHRPVRTGEAGASEQSVIDAVQTDAAINPGNSGGALVDLAGQVIGVNSAIASTSDSSTGQAGNIGVGFAIPSNDVVEVSNELIANGKAVHPQIGISAADAPGNANGTPGAGALVQQVTAGGPAASAGLKAGDIITKVDDRAVTDADSLIVAIRSHDPGNVVTVTYLRNGATATAQATLAQSSN